MPSDFKRGPRLRDPDALARFRLEHLNESCAACGKEPGAHVHHRNYRSRGGPDADWNFAWLGPRCHGALHGNPWVDEDGKRWDAAAVRLALSVRSSCP